MRRQRRSSRRTGAWPSNTTQTRRGRSHTIGFHPDFGQAIPPRRVAVGVRRPDFIQIHNTYATLSDPAARDFTQITTPRCPIRQPGISPRFTTPRSPNSHVVGFQTDGFRTESR
ncbi:hypothetical protein ACFX2I_027314 [Malus domestica]